jgi:hypothetical protein
VNPAEISGSSIKEGEMEMNSYWFVLLLFPSLGLFFLGLAALVWASGQAKKDNK